MTNGTPRPTKSSFESQDVHKVGFGEALSLDLRPIGQFVQESHEIEFLIQDVIVAGQPGVIAARFKSLKTSLAIDAIISMATAKPFLGYWPVPKPVSCLILSAESGKAAIKETCCRIAASKRLDARDIDLGLFSTLSPALQSKDCLAGIQRVIEERELRCLMIDPAYMAIADANQNDLVAMAKIFGPLGRIIESTGCSIILVHHYRKNSGLGTGCPTLEEVTGSGFAEWARFWLLLNRRREWDDTTGQHWLWLVTGGSAGFGARWWLDVREGRSNDPGGRVWGPQVVAASEAERKEKADREAQKAEKESTNLEDARHKVLEALHQCPEQRATKNRLKQLANIGDTKLATAISRLLAAGEILPVKVTAGNGQQYDGYTLAS
jgi:hypothetical protein